MLIVDERQASLGVMGALAQEVECQSAVLAQVAATLPPSVRSYHPFCTASRETHKHSVSTSCEIKRRERGERCIVLAKKSWSNSVRTSIASLEHS
jgi:hypothetical protein